MADGFVHGSRNSSTGGQEIVPCEGRRCLWVMVEGGMKAVILISRWLTQISITVFVCCSIWSRSVCQLLLSKILIQCLWYHSPKSSQDCVY